MKARKWVGLAFLLTGLMAVSALAGPPVRVIVKPPRGSIGGVDLRERDVCVSQCLSLYLEEWLAAAPDVRLVDEVQAQAVLGSLMSPAWVRAPGALHAAFSAVVPVEAAVTWEWKTGSLTLQVHRAGTVKEKTVPWAGAPATPGALKAVTEFLATELGIDPASSPLSLGLPADHSGVAEAYYLTQRMRAEWVDNSGVMQLEALQTFLKRLPKDVWASAAIVRSGAALSTDRRAVPNPAGSLMMVQQALPGILGTAFEPLALEFCRVNRYKPETIEKDLIGMIAKLGMDDVEAALDQAGKADGPEAALPRAAGGSDNMVDIFSGPKTAVQQAGAIRCLGVLQSKAALPIMATIAKSSDPRLRQAVAAALGDYAAPAGEESLKKLLSDADAKTALLAAWALQRHGQRQADLAVRAVACLKAEPGCAEALAALAESGGPAEAPLLQAYVEHANPRFREQAVKGLLRLGVLADQPLKRALADPDAGVVRAALAGMKPDQLVGLQSRLVALANHPDNSLAESARMRLTAVAPAAPLAHMSFELTLEHPYARRAIVDELVGLGTPEALALLEEATDNAEPHTRAYALARLAEKGPERAMRAAMRLVNDPHRWVRLQAAAVAAAAARPADEGSLKQALASESDEATRLYLEDALARAEGRPAPAPRPAVNRVKTDATQVFLCGHGADCATSPVQGYYDLSYNPDEPAKKAQAAGKVFLARANKTAKNPAQVFLNSGWRDGFWLGLDEDFGDLAALDGIVLGEESMYFRPWNEWAGGWRLFCREAGLDAKRVAGDRENLTALEKQAYLNWEQRVAVEGFNVMTDWIKRSYGKRKPGFQVCTFMPDQNGPCDYDRKWKFDIGAGYYYETNNRHRYTQIRRFKTLWPERPVIWLCDGNPTSGADAPLNYKYKPLTTPLVNPHAPPFADALCAWMAGAQPGYFYSKLAINKDMKPGPSASGVWVTLEEMSAGSPELKKALDSMFRGVDEVYRTDSEMKQAHAEQANRGLELGGKEVEIPDLTGQGPAKDSFSLRMAAEREAMRLGILLEQQVVWSCTRLLSDLPRLPTTNEVLLVGDIRAQTGALRLPTHYDFLDSVNKIAGSELARYRLIAVAGSEKMLLRDAAMTTLSAWLRQTPGLLVVQGWLPTDNTAEAATAADLDGTLQEDWPWEKDVARAEKGYRVTGPGAGELGTGLVYWQGAGFQGGVLFDQSDLAPEALRERINKLVAEKKVGVSLSGPIGMEMAEWPGGAALVSCKKAPAAEAVLPGLDLMTGATNPVLTLSRMGALVTGEFRGRHAAAHGGVAVLCGKPIAALNQLQNGMEVDCGGGLIQAVAAGPVEVSASAALPVWEGDKVLPWVLLSAEPGVARLRSGETGPTVTLVRATGMVRITTISSK